MQVTTKGAGLNPNAKVWQEIPSHQDDVPEWAEDTTWLLTYPPPAMISEGMGFLVADYCLFLQVICRPSPHVNL